MRVVIRMQVVANGGPDRDQRRLLALDYSEALLTHLANRDVDLHIHNEGQHRYTAGCYKSQNYRLSINVPVDSALLVVPSEHAVEIVMGDTTIDFYVPPRTRIVRREKAG